MWYYLGMKEKEPSSVRKVISNLESSKNIIDRYGAESLRELSLSGAYLSALPHNTSNEPGLTKILRVVRRTEVNNKQLSIILSQSSGKEYSQLISTLLKVTKKLPVFRRLLKEEEFLALNTLRQGGFNTIASMAIIEDSISGGHTVEMRFPRVFTNLDPNIPPSQRNTFGLAVAVYFLKKVPFR